MTGFLKFSTENSEMPLCILLVGCNDSAPATEKRKDEYVYVYKHAQTNTQL